MKTLLINCDRCKEKVDGNDVRQYTEKDFDEHLIDRFDLCPSCNTELEAWLNSKNPEG